MKKALSYFMVLAMLIMTLVVPTESYQAYEANLSVSVSASTVKIGDTVTVTVKAPGAASGPVSLYFPTDVFEHVSTSTEVQIVGGTLQFSIGKGGRAASDTVTVKLKAKTSGTANLKVEATGDIYDFDSLEEVTLKGASTSVTVENKAAAPQPGDGGGTTTQQGADDNSLSSLTLSSGTLSPSFKGNVTKYTATVGYDVTEVTVYPKTSNKNATIESITDGGTVKLKVGENTIKIVVKAINGVKATYTIVVTRKAQETTTLQPTETESETTTPDVNEILQWNGEQLQIADKIPAENIPEAFESQLLVVNGQQMQGLSFTKGDLKVLYLNNTNGAGSLYVYDETLETIYPFIKLTSEKNYVMVLLPDEQNAPAPEGFESCTFSIEGKGIIRAYQLKEEVTTGTEEVEDSTMSWNLFGAETFYAAEAKVSDFYLIYCMNDNGEKGWYMYDSVEGTFQRYLATAPSVQAGGEPTDDSDLQDKYAELEKEINAAKMTQYIIIAIAAAIIVILIIIIVVLVVKKRPEDDGYWDDVNDEDEEEDTEVVTTADVAAPVIEEKVEEVEGDDEIEIEFYNMEEAIVEETEKSEKVVSKDDDNDLEFIDFE